MKFNSLTHTLSLVILVITALYTLMYSGLTGVLLASAVAFIALAFMEQFELVVALTVIFALTYTLYLKKFLRKLEGFENSTDIVNRVGDMQQKYKQHPSDLRSARLEPAGVYNPSVEGFEDVQPDVPKEGASQSSSSASAKRTSNQVDPEQVQEVTDAVNGAKKSDKDIQNEELQSATNTLFKSGKMPSENMGGPNLDAGQTMMKAMESFDSNTVNAMTTDTKKLLETQKGLMNMLTQMRPVLADGKELLQTFSGMFGNNNGGGGGMPFKL